MSKFFSALIAAVMMAAGLVVATGGAAQAVCPYNGCHPTYTTIDAPNRVDQHEQAVIRVKVTSAGEGRPPGKVTLRVKRRAGDYTFLDVKEYGDERWVTFRTTRLHQRGTYVVRAFFDRKPGSPYRDSDSRETFRVVR